MTFDEIIKIRSIDILNAKIKIVRHKDNRIDINQIYETDRLKFDAYQGSQGRDVFNCDYIASFLGAENHTAKFIGLYKVNGKISEHQFFKKYPVYIFWKKFFGTAQYFYDLEKVNGFDDFIDRILINWGGGALTWVQNNIKKEIIEILPKGYVKEFRGYLELILTFNELKRLINNPSANKILHNRLTAVNGIYLITDKKTGGQYIGSTYGANGIWGRWSRYADTNGHGGNVELRRIISSQPNYRENFIFSILQTLPTGLAQQEIIEYEKLYKNKLGRKALILNRN